VSDAVALQHAITAAAILQWRHRLIKVC